MLRWFEEGGNNSDVVISSRVRLAVILMDIIFLTRCQTQMLKAGKKLLTS